MCKIRKGFISLSKHGPAEDQVVASEAETCYFQLDAHLKAADACEEYPLPAHLVSCGFLLPADIISQCTDTIEPSKNAMAAFRTAMEASYTHDMQDALDALENVMTTSP